jgi:hypothetical protein
MNSIRRLFVNARRNPSAARLMVAAGVAALLSGCMADTERRAQLEPASPIADEVARVASRNTDYPSFNEIPLRAGDVRPLRAFGRAADDIEKAGADLEQATAPGTWTLESTQAFAAGAQRAAGPQTPAPKAADTNAFVREQQRRATPPPPPQR